MRFITLGIFLLLTIGLLSGCMYPQQELTQNQTPYKDQVQTVQKAVDDFKKDNGGILPIKTKDGNTPIYQKYQIDFKKIVPKYLTEPPGNAFESGGIFQYVLITPETNPTVKLLDLRMADTIRELKLRIKAGGYPPFKKQLAENVYSLDFKQLGLDKPLYAVSPFTQQNLPLVIDGSGEIFVDYRSDLYQAIKKNNISVKPGEDIRWILTKDSLFVPAYSLSYTVDPKTKEPVFLAHP